MLLCLAGIVWGRILNHAAYLLVHEYASMTPTGACPACHHRFLWYQRIPILSYLFMRGRCPHCRSLLAPYNAFVELLTGLTLCALYYSQSAAYFAAYFIFFSALLITIRTDLETMLIARACTVYLIPLGLLLSTLKLLPLSLFESMLGATIGYLLLYGMMKLFSLLTGRAGMGLGDLDLLAFIGAFVGPSGCWLSLLIGSTLGSLAGCLIMLFMRRSKETPIPFGPFLALGAISFVLWKNQLLALLFSV
jgi:leader peptidase (prepilin peptidase) / N-methyltransferase